MVKIKVNVMIYMYCIFLLYYMSASASLSFYRAFLLFYLCIFVCILCIGLRIFICCHFGVINDDNMITFW